MRLAPPPGLRPRSSRQPGLGFRPPRQQRKLGRRWSRLRPRAAAATWPAPWLAWRLRGCTQRFLQGGTLLGARLSSLLHATQGTRARGPLVQLCAPWTRLMRPDTPVARTPRPPGVNSCCWTCPASPVAAPRCASRRRARTWRRGFWRRSRDAAGAAAARRRCCINRWPACLRVCHRRPGFSRLCTPTLWRRHSCSTPPATEMRLSLHQQHGPATLLHAAPQTTRVPQARPARTRAASRATSCLR
jgi:hypothetical protein